MSFNRVWMAGAMAAALLAGMSNAQARGCNRGDEAMSTIVGAVIGGVIGGQFGNGGDDRALGAVAGAVLGGAAGNSMANSGCDGAYARGSRYREPVQTYDNGYDYSGANYSYYDDESDYYGRAFETAEPYQRVRWDDPRSGNYGYVEPSDWYQDDSGNDCRQFEQTIYIDGRPQRGTGTACREPDGSWRIVD